MSTGPSDRFSVRFVYISGMGVKILHRSLFNCSLVRLGEINYQFLEPPETGPCHYERFSSQWSTGVRGTDRRKVLRENQKGRDLCTGMNKVLQLSNQ